MNLHLKFLRSRIMLTGQDAGNRGKADKVPSPMKSYQVYMFYCIRYNDVN